MKRWFKIVMLIIGAVLIGAVVVSAAIKAVGGSSTRALAADVNPGAATTTVATDQDQTEAEDTDTREKLEELDPDTILDGQVQGNPDTGKPEFVTANNQVVDLWLAEATTPAEQKAEEEALSGSVNSLTVDLQADQLQNNPFYVNNDRAAWLYGFSKYDQQLVKLTGFSDALSFPLNRQEFHADWTEGENILWQVGSRAMHDVYYADALCRAFVKCKLPDGSSLGKDVNTNTTYKIVKKVSKAFKEFDESDVGNRTWERFLEYDDAGNLVVKDGMRQLIALSDQTLYNLVYLGTTNESPAIHFAGNREQNQDLLRRATEQTEPETETWHKFAFIRKSGRGAGRAEFEIWFNELDLRPGIPGIPSYPTTQTPPPVIPTLTPAATPTPPAQGNRPTPTPGQGNQPTPTPVVVVTATPIPTPPGQGNPSVTPTPVVVTVTPVPDTPTPVPNTPVPDTPTPVPPTPTPGKRPEEIIEDDHPNRQDSDGVIMPGDQEDEEDDLVPVVDHDNGYTDSDGDYVQPADDWNPGRQDDSWTYTYVEEEYDDTGYNGPAQDTTPTIPSGNGGGTGDGGGTSYVEPEYDDADHSWDPAPGTYTAPEDCNDNGSVQDELSQVVDDTAGYSDPLAYNVTPQQAEQEYNDQEEEVVPDGVNGSGGVDNSWMGDI